MHQLFYISSAAAEADHEVKKDVDDILKAAHTYNPARGITGVLMYRAGIFLQFIEGEKTEVLKLFNEKIKKDRRHSNLTEMFFIDGGARIFDQWSMDFIEIKELEIKLLNEILSWNKLIEASPSIGPELILRLLERFRKKNEIQG